MKHAGTILKWKLSYKREVVLVEKLTSETKEACIEAKLPEVYKWTAETPNLYDFTVESATQEVTVRCGFRRIEIKDKNFRVNNDNFSEIFFQKSMIHSFVFHLLLYLTCYLAY